jgi:hypothetical protein
MPDEPVFSWKKIGYSINRINHPDRYDISFVINQKKNGPRMISLNGPPL